MHSFKTKNYFIALNIDFGLKTAEFTALELVDRIILNMDKMETPTGIFLDLSKSFDTHDHEILLNKLKFYGVHGIALKLIASYLTDHKQFVEMHDTKSDFLTITAGVLSHRVQF